MEKTKEKKEVKKEMKKELIVNHEEKDQLLNCLEMVRQCRAARPVNVKDVGLGSDVRNWYKWFIKNHNVPAVLLKRLENDLKKIPVGLQDVKRGSFIKSWYEYFQVIIESELAKYANDKANGQ